MIKQLRAIQRKLEAITEPCFFEETAKRQLLKESIIELEKLIKEQQNNVDDLK